MPLIAYRFLGIIYDIKEHNESTDMTVRLIPIVMLLIIQLKFTVTSIFGTAINVELIYHSP